MPGFVQRFFNATPAGADSPDRPSPKISSAERGINAISVGARAAYLRVAKQHGDTNSHGLAIDCQ
jgi:hypothetical protein